MKVSRQDGFPPIPLTTNWLRGLPLMRPNPYTPISGKEWGHTADSPLHQSAVGAGPPGPLSQSEA